MRGVISRHSVILLLLFLRSVQKYSRNQYDEAKNTPPKYIHGVLFSQCRHGGSLHDAV